MNSLYVGDALKFDLVSKGQILRHHWHIKNSQFHFTVSIFNRQCQSQSRGYVQTIIITLTQHLQTHILTVAYQSFTEGWAKFTSQQQNELCSTNKCNTFETTTCFPEYIRAILSMLTYCSALPVRILLRGMNKLHIRLAMSRDNTFPETNYRTSLKCQQIKFNNCLLACPS